MDRTPRGQARLQYQGSSSGPRVLLEEHGVRLTPIDGSSGGITWAKRTPIRAWGLWEWIRQLSQNINRVARSGQSASEGPRGVVQQASSWESWTVQFMWFPSLIRSSLNHALKNSCFLAIFPGGVLNGSPLWGKHREVPKGVRKPKKWVI